MKLGAFSKLQGQAPVKPANSFFVGRKLDDKYTARLVSNGALQAHPNLIDSYLPSEAEHLLYFNTMAEHEIDFPNGYYFTGDLSGAYYTTRGEGYLRLPHDWPAGVGGFSP